MLMSQASSDALSLCRHNRYDDLVKLLDNSHSASAPRSDWAGVADEHGNTLLLVAAQNGLKRICKLLLRRGVADVREINKKGKGVLHFCKLYGHDELGQYLREKGAVC